MARKNRPAESAPESGLHDKASEAAHEAAESAHNKVLDDAAADDGGSQSADPEFPPPQRFNGEVLPCVATAATTITGCSENEMKNFLASADYIARNITLHLADNWKKICRTAKLQSDEGKSAKVPISVAIVINHENLLLLDTRVKTSFSLKYQETSETQEDLRQVLFSLPSAPNDEATGDDAEKAVHAG